MRTLGIIGFGQMAQFMCKFLNDKFNVFASDRDDKSSIAKQLGVKFVSIEEAASKEIIILSVPINQIRSTMLRIRNKLREGSLLLDICSVKVNPLKAMLDLAPENIEIIGTHPLFGPQSGANGIKGLKIVLCPVRTSKTKDIERFCESLGLEVIICNPEEHDKSIAETQALEHFIGRALINIDAQEGKITTPTFSNLMALKNTFKNDSLDLFRLMEKENPFAKEVRKRFLNELNKIQEDLE